MCVSTPNSTRQAFQRTITTSRNIWMIRCWLPWSHSKWSKPLEIFWIIWCPMHISNIFFFVFKIKFYQRFDYPILMIHGSKDIITNPRDSFNFINRIASKDKTFKSFDEGFHQLHDDNELYNLQKNIHEWCKARAYKSQRFCNFYYFFNFKILIYRISHRWNQKSGDFIWGAQQIHQKNCDVCCFLPCFMAFEVFIVWKYLAYIFFSEKE